mmetsp:Transcript_4902/g.10691  ORF Transcript_4902/g.10691 Transcript_4902/m.10691 type:complete len:394 (+) Transcript_4902:392-1573(+)
MPSHPTAAAAADSRSSAWIGWRPRSDGPAVLGPPHRHRHRPSSRRPSGVTTVAGWTKPRPIPAGSIATQSGEPESVGGSARRTHGVGAASRFVLVLVLVRLLLLLLLRALVGVDVAMMIMMMMIGDQAGMIAVMGGVIEIGTVIMIMAILLVEVGRDGEIGILAAAAVAAAARGEVIVMTTGIETNTIDVIEGAAIGTGSEIGGMIGRRIVGSVPVLGLGLVRAVDLGLQVPTMTGTTPQVGTATETVIGTAPLRRRLRHQGNLLYRVAAGGGRRKNAVEEEEEVEVMAAATTDIGMMVYMPQRLGLVDLRDVVTTIALLHHPRLPCRCREEGQVVLVAASTVVTVVAPDRLHHHRRGTSKLHCPIDGMPKTRPSSARRASRHLLARTTETGS